MLLLLGGCRSLKLNLKNNSLFNSVNLVLCVAVLSQMETLHLGRKCRNIEDVKVEVKQQDVLGKENIPLCSSERKQLK